MSTLADISDEACAVACVLVSNPQSSLRTDGDGWQKRVNDLIRALRDRRVALEAEVATLKAGRDELRKLGNLSNALWIEAEKEVKALIEPVEYQDYLCFTRGAMARMTQEKTDLERELFTLKADNADLLKSWDEMQAEVLRLTDERDAARKLVELRTADLGSVAAERDRLKTAAREIYENLSSLEDEGFAPKTRLTWTETMDILRAALASNPSTGEEG